MDLSLELDADDWAELGRQLPEPAVEVEPDVPNNAASAPADLLPAAHELLRKAGQLDGPQLLALLVALSGNGQAGKRLLVRLRHSENVQVRNDGDTPIYHWVG